MGNPLARFSLPALRSRFLIERPAFHYTDDGSYSRCNCTAVGNIMQPHEYWLLDSVIVAPFPVGLLATSPENIIGAFNRPFHGMDYPQLVQTLIQLWRDDYLHYFDINHQDTLLTFDPDIIHATLAREIDVYYQVTPRGGAAWEAIAHPNWERFTCQSGSDHVRIEAGNRAVAETYLGLYPACFSVTILPETIAWRIEQPWSATYWKTLPVGYIVSFQTVAGTFDPEVYPIVNRQWAELTKWYHDPWRM